MVGNTLLLWKSLALGFSALLPVVNPFGSALVFLGLVGAEPPKVYRALARRIAINTVLFFAVIELVGSAILNFFGISLPIVQVAGGFVLAAMGWSLLNQKEGAISEVEATAASTNEAQMATGTLEQKAFYPFTFPVTTGPGCIVVMLTLSAHASVKDFGKNLLGHVGVFLSVIVLSGMIYFAYAHAPKLKRAISPATANGMLRVVSFILVCIGAQIGWNGLDALLRPLLHQQP